MEVSNSTLPLAGLSAVQGAEQARGSQAARPDTTRPVEAGLEAEGSRPERGPRGQSVDIEV